MRGNKPNLTNTNGNKMLDEMAMTILGSGCGSCKFLGGAVGDTVCEVHKTRRKPSDKKCEEWLYFRATN